MASGAAANDLVTKVLQLREVDKLRHDPGQNVAELLERIQRFLLEHETSSTNDVTHMVFDNYNDWWVDSTKLSGQSKSSYRLAIAEDNTRDTLYRYISNLYDFGVPMTLAERRTQEIRFVQDIEIWGNVDTTVKVEDLISADGGFMPLLGKTMRDIYPTPEFLDVMVYDATGVSKTKAIMKTSVRLVWSSIIVDRERACRIRDYMLHKFKTCEDSSIRELETMMQQQNQENRWDSVFNDSVYCDRHGVRMPLCDRVSPAPLKKPERRPFSPVCVMRFNYNGADLQGIEEICRKDDLEGFEWVKIGCIRVDAGTPLTEWTKPLWTGERPRSSVGPRQAAAPGAPPGSGPGGSRGGQSGGLGRTRPPRDGGEVRARLRTGGGSDPPQRARLGPRGPSQQQQPVQTIERTFDGTVAEFRERMEQHIGSDDGTYEQDEDKLVWRQAGEDAALIEFKASNRKVFIRGKNHQLRSLLTLITPFAREAESARSTTHTARTGASSRAGSEFGGASTVGSAVYAPSAVFAPSAVGAASNASGFGGGTREGPTEPSRRVVNQNFLAESSGELALTVGENVTITHDPDEQTRNVHRWVYGLNENSQDRGWFPLFYTSPLQEPTGAGGA